MWNNSRKWFECCDLWRVRTCSVHEWRCGGGSFSQSHQRCVDGAAYFDRYHTCHVQRTVVVWRLVSGNSYCTRSKPAVALSVDVLMVRLLFAQRVCMLCSVCCAIFHSDSATALITPGSFILKIILHLMLMFDGFSSFLQMTPISSVGTTLFSTFVWMKHFETQNYARK